MTSTASQWSTRSRIPVINTGTAPQSLRHNYSACTTSAHRRASSISPRSDGSSTSRSFHSDESPSPRYSPRWVNYHSPRQVDATVKIVLIGDSQVGKSSFLMRFADNNFTHSMVATIGIDFKIRHMEMDGKYIKVQVWDTAGQEKFATITRSYYRGAHGIIIMYDVTNRKSFDRVEEWLQSIHDNTDPNIRVPKMLVGNKTDKTLRRCISTKEGQALADKHNMMFVEGSALSGDGVEAAFSRLSSHILRNMPETLIFSRPDVNLDAPRKRSMSSLWSSCWPSRKRSTSPKRTRQHTQRKGNSSSQHPTRPTPVLV